MWERARGAIVPLAHGKTVRVQRVSDERGSSSAETGVALANCAFVAAGRSRDTNRRDLISNRIFISYEDIVDRCCSAWNNLIADTGRIRSIGYRDWAHKS